MNSGLYGWDQGGLPTGVWGYSQSSLTVPQAFYGRGGTQALQGGASRNITTAQSIMGGASRNVTSANSMSGGASRT